MMMKKGRDWTCWETYSYCDNMRYIGKNVIEGFPFPMTKNGIAWVEFRIPGSPIFNLDVWGVKEPK